MSYILIQKITEINVNRYIFTALQEGQQCKTPDQARGKCIRLKKCKSLLEMIQKVPLFEEDANFLRDSQCGYDNEPLVSFVEKCL